MPEFKLYSLDAIALAAGVGSILAAAYCIRANWRAVGDPDAGQSATVLGVVGIAVVLVFAFLEPEDWQIPNALYQAAQAGVAYLFAQRSQGPILSAHRIARGEFYSRWRAAGIGLVVSLIFVGVLVLVAVLSGEAAA